MLLMIHSVMRFAILALGVVYAVVCVQGLLAKHPFSTLARIMGSALAGLVHLQSTLGLVLVVMGLFTPKLIGHIVMMLAAAVQLQVLLIRNRKLPEPGYRLPLLGVGIGLVLIVGGLAAIGRSPWQINSF